MCMNCVSQSLPYVALALGGLQLPRLRGLLGPVTRDDPPGDADDPPGTGAADHEPTSPRVPPRP